MGNYQVVIEVEEYIDRFYRETITMYNADYDLNQIVADYVTYTKYPEKVLGCFDEYGFSEEDREDGRILKEAVKVLYKDLDRELPRVQTRVVKAALSDLQKEIMVELEP